MLAARLLAAAALLALAASLVGLRDLLQQLRPERHVLAGELVELNIHRQLGAFRSGVGGFHQPLVSQFLLHPEEAFLNYSRVHWGLEPQTWLL